MSTITPDQYGPWALIAGGSEGIGLCFARELASAGFNLLLLARRHEPLQAAREQLSSEFPVEIRTHALDLTAADIEDQLIDLVDGLEIGLLIYNAGAMHGVGLFLDEPLQKAQTLVQLNCHGPLHVAGEGNRMAASLLRGDDRRQSIAMMSAGAAGLYGLAVPKIPDSGSP